MPGHHHKPYKILNETYETINSLNQMLTLEESTGENQERGHSISQFHNVFITRPWHILWVYQMITL